MTKLRIQIAVEIETAAKDSPEEREQIYMRLIGAVGMFQAAKWFNQNNGATKIIGYVYHKPETMQ